MSRSSWRPHLDASYGGTCPPAAAFSAFSFSALTMLSIAYWPVPNAPTPPLSSSIIEAVISSARSSTSAPESTHPAKYPKPPQMKDLNRSDTKMLGPPAPPGSLRKAS